MFELDRSSLVVRPRKPLIDWVNALSDEDGHKISVAEAQDNPEIFLIPEVEDEHGLALALATHHEEIFEHLLWSWVVDESLWPKERSVEMLLSWCDVELAGTVFDLPEEPIHAYVDDEPDVSDESDESVN